MRRLVFQAFGKAPVTHPLEAGDLCLAKHEGGKYYLATVVDYRRRRVTFFDDGSETVTEVGDIKEAAMVDREAARLRYEVALDQAKQIASMDANDVVLEAIERVELEMGGSLGDDGMISYTSASGSESREGELLCSHLIGNFGALVGESPALAWMKSHWREVCEADADRSGTISERRRADMDRVSSAVSSMITTKLDILGAPPRLYRGDLCLALPMAYDVAQGDDPSRPLLAIYKDSTHVTFFDGDEALVSSVREIVPVTAAAKEQAILRYTKAVSQCKAVARQPSDRIVQAAVLAVKGHGRYTWA